MKKPFEKCRLCLQQKPLIKAHIVPKCLYDLKGNDPKEIVHKYSTENRPQRAPMGEYDSEILCKDCDGEISVWDEYACNFINKELPLIPWVSDTAKPLKLKSIKRFDYEKLTLFVVSLLWRSSISKRDSFKKVALGEKYENEAREIITNKNPYTNVFEYALNQLTIDRLSLGVMPPVRERFGQVNFYCFVLGKIELCIKCDQHPTSEEWKAWRVKKNQPLHLVWGESLGKRYQKYLNVIKQMKNE